ncbi:xanthine dehydrogenase small subunit [Pseudomonas sp. gcc21]|uniref:xanthine dehydrogenase small subunit n=1 Tax=Pseudomonas sp. gcc21 TaxID=2726989 RepID=UPI001451D3AE|nr:xanthine dehydrogenase small subunit [Pseudomonas sp. gcc21]QJD57475.1 xanthine dehydrogenase small subunit [Pseudomonas sp. gcc21]
MIEFYLNGRPELLEGVDPNLSILEWLRTEKRLTGTKEGCASGDCGACTVLLGVPGEDGETHYQSINSCIALIGSLHGRHLVTVDALRDEPAHPVQTAMVECHGSQCGFCTPGFIMSMVGLHREVTVHGRDCDQERLIEALAGNLCRCTGYRPIIEAGRQSIIDESAAWEGDALFVNAAQTPAPAQSVSMSHASGRTYHAPVSLAELRQLLADNPAARLMAGTTDLALEITQQLLDVPHLVSVERVPELQRLSRTESVLEIGAAVTYTQADDLLVGDWPTFGPLLDRLASLQIRNRGTLGGNIANASPIGDMPPPLLALGAELVLDSAEGERRVALDDFFLRYRKTALRPQEFIRSVRIPTATQDDRLFIYKVSKRLDDDISAVLGAFWFRFAGNEILDCRLAYGGMAATPKRAQAAEAALRGQAFDEAAVSAAINALAQDFTPLSDARASASYRSQIAGNLLRRALLEHRAGVNAQPLLSVTHHA